ncbi:MAG: hypothetical protein ACPL1K_00775 [Candidatus Kryptoniota bacterium]
MGAFKATIQLMTSPYGGAIYFVSVGFVVVFIPAPLMGRPTQFGPEPYPSILTSEPHPTHGILRKPLNLCPLIPTIETAGFLGTRSCKNIEGNK